MFSMYSKGFTLIELLTVVSIIGMLSSITINTLNKARDSADGAYTAATIRQYINAIQLYYDENGHYPLASRSCVDIPNCEFYNSNPITTVQEPALTSAIMTYIQTLPQIMRTPISYTRSLFLPDGSSFTLEILQVGPVYSCDVANNCPSATIYWAVKPGQPCGVTGAGLNVGTATICSVVLN